MTTGDKKSILIISSVAPYPVACGGSHALFHMINRLRNQYQFTLCTVSPSTSTQNFKDLEALWSDVEIIPYHTRPTLHKKNVLVHAAWYQLRGKLKGIFRKIGLISKDSDIRKYSRLYHSFHPPDSRFLTHLKSLMDTHSFDLIQVEFPDMLPLADMLPSTIPNLFVHHEIAYIRAERELALVLKQKKTDVIRLQQLKTAELGFLKKFDNIVVLTDNDKRILDSQLKGASIFTSPAAIDLNTDMPPNNENQRNTPYRLIAIGSESHFPNADGMTWFLSEVWPLLTQTNPDVELFITGNWSEHTINRLKNKRVIFTGFVQNLTPFFCNSILVVPIRIGSGMRMKIIEAVSKHVPFVSTSIGVEGLNFKHDTDCLIADNAANFAKNIKCLLDDRNKAECLSENALRTLKNKYSFESAIQKRTAIYEKILNP